LGPNAVAGAPAYSRSREASSDGQSAPRRLAHECDRPRVIAFERELLAGDDGPVGKLGEHPGEVLRPVVEPVELARAQQRVSAEGRTERVRHLLLEQRLGVLQHARGLL
jgi:hypothetical protein